MEDVAVIIGIVCRQLDSTSAGLPSKAYICCIPKMYSLIGIFLLPSGGCRLEIFLPSEISTKCLCTQLNESGPAIEISSYRKSLNLKSDLELFDRKSVLIHEIEISAVSVAQLISPFTSFSGLCSVVVDTVITNPRVGESG